MIVNRITSSSGSEGENTVGFYLVNAEAGIYELPNMGDLSMPQTSSFTPRTDTNNEWWRLVLVTSPTEVEISIKQKTGSTTTAYKESKTVVTLQPYILYVVAFGRNSRYSPTGHIGGIIACSENYARNTSLWTDYVNSKIKPANCIPDGYIHVDTYNTSYSCTYALKKVEAS